MTMAARKLRTSEGRAFVGTLLGSFYKRSLVLSLTLAILLMVTIPALLMFAEYVRFKSESIHVIERFVKEELAEPPLEQVLVPAREADIRQHIDTLVSYVDLVDFKVWRADGRILFSYRSPETVGRDFALNEELRAAIGKKRIEVEVQDAEAEAESMDLSAYGTLFEIYVPVLYGGKVVGALEIYRGAPRYHLLAQHVLISGALALVAFMLLYALLFGSFRRAAARIVTYDEQLTYAYARLGESYSDTVRGLIKALELRDMETEGHSERVVALAMHLADRLGLAEGERLALLLGAYLHDIGKIGVSDTILLKPGPLTPEERATMQLHVTKGYDIIKDIPALAPAAGVILCHHEKWNGAGYQRGLAGEAIPLVARIFALVDVFDALSHKRPYKQAISFNEACAIIEGDSGTHFDPALVALFLSMPEEEIMEAAAPPRLTAITAMVRDAIAGTR
jgi:HD-GYP domain-containing protein (c-di-GMP phosphodiesterase class II)